MRDPTLEKPCHILPLPASSLTPHQHEFCGLLVAVLSGWGVRPNLGMPSGAFVEGEAAVTSKETTSWIFLEFMTVVSVVASSRLKGLGLWIFSLRRWGVGDLEEQLDEGSSFLLSSIR